MVRGGLSEEATSEISWMDEKLPFMGNVGEGTPGRHGSQCKGPGAGTWLACLGSIGRPVWEEMRAEAEQGVSSRIS